MMATSSIQPADSRGPRLRAAAAARLAGIKTATLTAYVSRGQAPAPDGHYDKRTPWWYQATIEAWRGRASAESPVQDEIPAAETARARRICQELWDAIPAAGPAARNLYAAAIAVLGQATGDAMVIHHPGSALTAGDIMAVLADIPPDTPVAVVPTGPPDRTGSGATALRQVFTDIDIAWDHATSTGTVRFWADYPPGTYQAFEPRHPR